MCHDLNSPNPVVDELWLDPDSRVGTRGSSCLRCPLASKAWSSWCHNLRKARGWARRFKSDGWSFGSVAANAQIGGVCGRPSGALGSPVLNSRVRCRQRISFRRGFVCILFLAIFTGSSHLYGVCVCVGVYVCVGPPPSFLSAHRLEISWRIRATCVCAFLSSVPRPSVLVTCQSFAHQGLCPQPLRYSDDEHGRRKHGIASSLCRATVMHIEGQWVQGARYMLLSFQEGRGGGRDWKKSLSIGGAHCARQMEQLGNSLHDVRPILTAQLQLSSFTRSGWLRKGGEERERGRITSQQACDSITERRGTCLCQPPCPLAVPTAVQLLFCVLPIFRKATRSM